MSDARIELLIASPPEYDRLVVEVERSGLRIARVVREDEEAAVELDVFTASGCQVIRLPLSEFISALSRAGAELDRTYGA